MKTIPESVKAEMNVARKKWRCIGSEKLRELRKLLGRHHFSVSLGDVSLVGNGWYVTHAGLLRLAERRRCAGIRVTEVRQFCDPTIARWVFKATVYKARDSKGFVGYGDADPTNVSSVVHGAEMRVAETRAVSRALRKAYGVGLCSLEELGWNPKSSGPDRGRTPASSSASRNEHSNGQTRLRDRFCLLIRQHQLDADLVKAYAAEYCDVATVREASRDQIEKFINHLAERAAKDREGLLCQLNSYRKPQEVTK